MTQARNASLQAGGDESVVPLTARSVLASALLGMDPPELPVAQLVRLTGLFGISENRARVALSRMVAGGEATSDGSGRYRLAGHLAARQSRQSASRAGATAPYDGEWWLAVVTTTGSSADIRGTRRRALAYGRLAELREGVWMRPANLAVRLPDPMDGDVELMTARPRDAAALAASPLGPDGVVGTGARPAAPASVRSPPTGPKPWRRGSSCRPRCCGTCRRIRSCPPSSCPTDWPGAPLRATYDAWDARYRATLRDWSRR